MSLEAVSLVENNPTIISITKKPMDNPLREQVRESLKHYFRQLDGHHASDLYQLVIAEVEQPLLETVMTHTGGNQTQAAKLLGISRCTLRKKLAQYDLD